MENNILFLIDRHILVNKTYIDTTYIVYLADYCLGIDQSIDNGGVYEKKNWSTCIYLDNVFIRNPCSGSGKK